MIKTITKHMNSTDVIAEIYDTIRVGDYGAYVLNLVLDDLESISGDVRLRFERSDGQIILTAPVTVSGNTIIHELTASEIAVVSPLNMWVQFSESNLYTPIQIVFDQVLAVPSGTPIPDTDEYPEYLAAIEATQEATADAAAAALAAEQATTEVEAILEMGIVVEDQTTPQTFINGVPKLAADRVIDQDNQIADKKFVVDTVATVTADDFDHNDLDGLQGGGATERYHMTAAENAALHAHSNKTALDAVSGTNTGDQDVDGAISTHNSDAAAHADKESKSNKVTSLSSASTNEEYPSAKAVFRRLQNKNGLYEGLDLSTIFSNAAEFHTAISTGDFSKIRIGDYWPISLSGSFRDVSSYTVPSGIIYYSDSGLTISAGTTSIAYDGIYYNTTAVSFTISSTTYYVAIGACLAYFVRTLSNATLKLEVAAINPYINYGDTAFSANHVLLISRDCLPITLKIRTENSVWYNTGVTNPWIGSALYETLNNPTYGLLPLIVSSDIGQYIYAGPNSKGMRWLGEVKASGVATPTSWAWVDRGKIFLPIELELWNQTVYTNNPYCMGLNNQIDIFKGSTRHIVKGLGNGGSRCNWWSASAFVGSATVFSFVNSSGFPGNYIASTPIGVPACFLLS